MEHNTLEQHPSPSTSSPSSPPPAVILRGFASSPNDLPISYLVARPTSYASALASVEALFPHLLNPPTSSASSAAVPEQRSRTLVLERDFPGVGPVRLTASGWNTAPLVVRDPSEPLVIGVTAVDVPLAISTGAAQAESATEASEPADAEEPAPASPEAARQDSFSGHAAETESVASLASEEVFWLTGPAGAPAATPVVIERDALATGAEQAEEDPAAEDTVEPAESVAEAPPVVTAEGEEHFAPPPAPEDRMLDFEVTSFINYERKKYTVRLAPNAHVCYLLTELEDLTGYETATCSDKYRLKHGPDTLDWEQTLSSFASASSVTAIHLHRVGRRQEEPAIYVLPPVDLDDCHLQVASIDGSWISRHHPRTTIATLKGNRAADWFFSVEVGGRVRDRTGRSAKYIVCEVEDIFYGRPFHLASRDGVPDRLCNDSPAFARILSLRPSNSYILPARELLSRLPGMLEQFPLTPAMRTAFLDYVTPRIEAFLVCDPDPRNLFRFATQAELDEAIELHMWPTPEVVARVYLLFNKAREEEIRMRWRDPDRVDWALAAGVDVEKAENESLFRVIAWGAIRAMH
ncbi:hypothetical protein JCM10213_008112 [Rhodosporidiobolus nylandii]